jgi:hypothetical protein
MKRKKSINNLHSQLVRLLPLIGLRAYFAYQRAFYARFSVQVHSMDCKKFVEKYGKDYKM